MKRNKVQINIDWMDRNFGAAPQNEAIACVATGRTLEEVKKNIVEALESDEHHFARFLDKNAPLPELDRAITTGPAWAYLKIADGCPTALFGQLHYPDRPCKRNGNQRPATEPLCQRMEETSPGNPKEDSGGHPLHLQTPDPRPHRPAESS